MKSHKIKILKKLEFLKKVANMFAKSGNIYTNTISSVKKLFEKFDLYIVSNCQTGYIECFLNLYNLKDYFKDYECFGRTNLPKLDLDPHIDYIKYKKNKERSRMVI